MHYKINFLLRLALQKVAFLPFTYITDKYRFLLFRNEIDRRSQLNSKWWDLRVKHSGIMPPVYRNNEQNFDAGVKYQIAANVPYLKYFISFILQFQFQRAICRMQGTTEHLYMCDLYGNRNIGEKFKTMLEMGSSRSWEEALESFTGENRLESSAILDFFKPLHEWLKGENLARGYPVGWM